MTNLALPERWTFGGYDLSSYAVVAGGNVGADEFPPLRGDNPPFTGLSGRQFLAKLDDSRRIGLALFVLSTDASGAITGSPSQQARANLDALYKILAARTQAQLVRTLPDGSTRQALAEVVAVNNVGDPANHEIFPLTVQFELADPLFYGTAVVDSARSTASSPTNFSMTNPGNIRMRNIKFDFTGPITNPRVTNNTTNEYVEYIGVVASTKHLILDAQLWTATNDGADVQGAIGHSGAVAMLEVDPGSNSFTVTAGTPGGSLTSTLTPGFR